MFPENKLREKSPNTELFLVRVFPHSGWMRRDTSYLSVFSPNAGKYGTEITSYLGTFHAVSVMKLLLQCFKYWEQLGKKGSLVEIISGQCCISYKPVTWFAVQIKWLVSIWNKTRPYYRLVSMVVTAFRLKKIGAQKMTRNFIE